MVAAVVRYEDDDREPLSKRLEGIIHDLESRATDRVGKRTSIEARWLDDLHQYHGTGNEWGPSKDQFKVTPENYKGGRSKVNINLTRAKTNAMSARLVDLLFPTDDKNWAIKPTPVPELDEAARKAADFAEQKREEAAAAAEEAEAAAAAQEQAAAQGQQVDPSQMSFAQGKADGTADLAKQAASIASRLRGQIDEAKKRADRMSLEIDDSLTECRYQAGCRDAIEDACKIGTGIMKGPIVGDKPRPRWREQQGQYSMEMKTDPRPSLRRVDPWSFFPDPDAKTPEDCEGFFERHLMNRKQLRRLSRLPGFSKEAVGKLIKSLPQSGTTPSYLNELRTITGESSAGHAERFTVWEFTGALECEQIKTLAEAMGQDDVVKEYDEIDPLLELNAVIWFCDNCLLKFAIYPLDSGEPIYSVFNLEKDETSMFGYGIPFIMRHSQRSFSAGWRMMLDNAGLGVGPQIIIDKEKIEPQDGIWELAPRKIWVAKNGIPKDGRAFEAFDVPMHQQEIAGLIALSEQHIDKETAMPLLAQGEQGTGVTKTAQGMAILMNSSNVVFRRIVKNFDDDMTTPNIRRMYDWFMQFSEKPETKGDYEVDARGSSVLLVREMQAQNLMTLMLQFSASPVYSHMLKHANNLRTLFNAHMLVADEHIHDDDTIAAKERQAAEAAAEQAAAAQPQQQQEMPEDPQIHQDKMQMERDKLDAQVLMSRQEVDSRVEIARLQRETTLMQFAEKMNLTMDETRALLLDKKAERESKEKQTQIQADSKERIVAAEIAMADRTGQSAGGSV